MLNFEAIAKSFIDPKQDDEHIRKIAELTAQCAQKNELLRDGFDLVNAIMLRTGLVFKIADPEYAPLIAKVKTWNLRVQEIGAVNVVSGVAS